MLIVRNNIFPFKGYKAVNICGILFCRKNAVLDPCTLNHERIHTDQMAEMLYIPYYIWYGIEFLLRWIKYGSTYRAYRNIGFEREAYKHQKDVNYLDSRKCYAWIRYL